MNGAKRKILGTALAAVFLFIAVAAFAGEDLSLSGRVLGPKGVGQPGAIISDGHDAIKSNASGQFDLNTQSGRVISVAAPPGLMVKGRWWWPARDVCGRTLTIRLEPAPQKAEPTLALLSDAHLFSPDAPSGHPAPADIARRPMRAWQIIAGRLKKSAPDLTLVTGDLCSDADYADMKKARAQMALAAHAVKMLPRPVRVLPGNHDVRYSRDQKPGIYLSLWREHLGPARHVFLMPQAAFILLDNLGHSRTVADKPRSCGRTPAVAVNWLKSVLRLIPHSTPLVLLSHYPLLSPLAGNNPLSAKALVRARSKSGLGLRNTDQNASLILKLMRKRKVLALIHGHEHAHHQSTLHTRSGDLHVLGLPAVCGGWWRGDRPWRSYSFPPGYVTMKIVSTKDGPRFTHRFEEIRLD